MREEKVVDLSSGLTITPLKLDLSIDACNMSFTSASNNAERGQGDTKDIQNGDGGASWVYQPIFSSHSITTIYLFDHNNDPRI